VTNRFLALCLFSLLAGCQLPQPRSWHLDAHKERGTVQFCLSNELACPQKGGISLDDISVYRYDNVHDNQLVWETSPENEITEGEKIDGVVTFGIPPANWRSKMPPPEVVCGKAYLVNPPAKFFALKCDGSVVVFDFPHLEMFFREEAGPVPTKKGAGH